MNLVSALLTLNSRTAVVKSGGRLKTSAVPAGSKASHSEVMGRVREPWNPRETGEICGRPCKVGEEPHYGIFSDLLQTKVDASH